MKIRQLQFHVKPTRGIHDMVQSLGYDAEDTERIASMAEVERRMQADMFGDEYERAVFSDGTLTITGYIDDATYAAVRDAIPQGLEKVRINSPGGVAAAGIACYNLLAEHDVAVVVDGMAFSAASVIAMAGKPCTIKKGATLGIHQPWSFAVGNAEDMRHEAGLLDVMGKAILDIYMDRVPAENRAEVKAAYEAETLYNGEDAVAAGLADECEKPKPAKKADKPPAKNEQAGTPESEFSTIDLEMAFWKPNAA